LISFPWWAGQASRLPSSAGADFRSWHKPARYKLGRACPLCPGGSDVDLFSYGKGIVDLDAEVSNRALDLGMAEEKLHRSEVACAPVDEGRLGSPE
jgi:hypothetical protein